MRKNIFYVLIGFAVGILSGSVFFIPQLAAQSDFGSFQEEKLSTAVPSYFGSLVAVNGVNYYFQGKGGNIYILRQRTGSELDTHVTVIPRSE
jgi:hypothetical protein